MTLTTSFSLMNLARSAAAALLVTALFVPLPSAEARPGKGLSQGSRGLKTYQAPPSTRTAPTTAQPMQRSATPQPGTAQPGVGATQAGAATAAAGAAQTSRFGGGFTAGLLGAGLIGGLLGAGFFGGLGSLTAILGFMLQIVLIGGIAYLAYALLFRRRQPAAVGPQGGLQDTLQRNDSGPGGMNAGPGMTPARPAGGSRIGSAIGGSAAAPTMATGPLTIDGADYASFERLLSVVQLAYGREDRDALRSAVTPEMLGYFAEELDANAANGVRNELGEPKLLSGDLAEAWAEASGEYATVAMHYALTDAMVDRATGKVVEGSRTEPQDGTELWTFVRRPGSGPAGWRLSAIQQTA